LRKAHDEVMPAVIDINQAVGQSQPLFAALTALKKRQSVWSSFSESQKRIVDSAIKQMESSGVGLESVAREKFNKLQLELAELQTKFSNNVLDSTKAFKLKIETAAEIDGLPDSVRGLAASNAVANGDAGATAESGPWVLTLDMPCYLPSMQHLKNRELREKLYRAYVTRSSSGEHDNAPLITRILQIKRELANMLGYNSHADKSLSTKMAPSVDSVRELTTMLQRQSIGAAQKELEDLKKFALTEGFSDDIALWDIQFWSERLREKEYQFEEEKLRVYFPLDAVLKGLFDLATRLFGVVVEPAHGSTSTWNNDVKFFDIKDEASGEHIASFFLDPYSRPADKKGGAWMDVCHGRSKVTLLLSSKLCQVI
jgi:oligopeptidase A